MTSTSTRHLLSKLSIVALCWLVAPLLARATPPLDYSTYLPYTGQTHIAADGDGALYIASHWTHQEQGVIEVLVWKIDPTRSGPDSLVWEYELFGASGDTLVNALAVADDGRVAVIGTTTAASGLPTVNAYDDLAGTTAIFVSVINAAGDGLAYSTYLGENETYPMAVAFERGRVYLVGWAVEHTIPTRNPLVTGGSGNAFLSVLDPSQSGDASLIYSTYFGTTSNVLGMDVAANSSGDAFVLGVQDGGATPEIPLSSGAFQTAVDTFWVARIDPDETGDDALVYATFLGGSGAESLRQGVGAIAVDSDGNAHVVGATTSTDYPTTSGAFQEARGGGEDVYVAKLNPTGTDLVWATYVGGDEFERATDVTVHSDGRVSFTGYTASTMTYPLGECALVRNPSTNNAAFVSQLSANGRELLYSDIMEDVEVGTGDSLTALSDGDVALHLRTGNRFFPILGGFQVSSDYPSVVAVLPTEIRCADLEVNITSVEPSGEILVGEVVTAIIEVDNPGPNRVRDVVLYIANDKVLQILSARGPNGDCPLVDMFPVCDLGSISAGDQALVEVQATPVVGGMSLLMARAETSDVELDIANDRDEVEILCTDHTGPCGAVTYQGSCDGTVLTFCEHRGTEAETIYVVDCADVFPGSSGICVEIDPVYGHDCAVADGENCYFVNDRGAPVFALCDGDETGCVVDDTTGDATCQSVGFSCAAPVGEAFAPVCEGDVVVLDCNAGQPMAYDCAALGGSCQDAACSSLPEGAPCDENLVCEGDLTCHDLNDTCVAPENLCDPETHVATCNGSVVTYCTFDVEVIQQTDCGTLFTGGGGACGTLFTCLDDGDDTCDQLGVGCHGDGEGAPCDLATGIFCGPGFGCLLEADDEGNRLNRCRDIGTCAHGDEHVGCVGDIATTCYSNGTITAAEASGVDCSVFGSRCELDAETGFPRCIADVSGTCGMSELDDSLFGCAPGLICTFDDATGVASCQAVPDAGSVDNGGVEPDAARPDGWVEPDAARPDGWVEPDAGQPDAARPDAGAVDAAVPPRDSGTPDAGGEDEDPGCGCGDCRSVDSPGASARSLAIVPVVALLLLARRRRA